MNAEKLLFLFLFALWSGWAVPANAQQPALLEVGDLKVTAEEFAYLYEKNYEDHDSIYLKEHVLEYLDLYTKFKLKVAAAYARGFDTTKAFTGELAGYQKQLARPYLKDPSINEAIVQEAYDRLKQEVSAAHILIRVNNWNDPADTLQAYKKVLELKEQADNGRPFASLATQYSEDPSAKSNQGDLGYFTSMQMVYAFESAVYQGEEGEVVGPVRTQFGYHLIHIKDKIPARGARKASHIMVRATEGISKEDSTAAAEKAQGIYAKLQAGGNWEDLCRQFSDDATTKGKGGSLPWFSAGQMVPEFANAAFGLEEVGAISEPVKTPYGWHIIRLDGKKGIEPLDSLRAQIRQRISKDSRSELSQKRFIAKLKRENGFKEDAGAFEQAANVFDTRLTAGKWVAPQPSAASAKALFTVGQDPFTVQDFYLFVAEKQQKGISIPPKMYAEKLYEDFVEQSVLDYEKAHLAEKHPEYRHLLNEYKEGIMLFNIMTEEVWEKAMADSAGLRQYYEKNKGDYRWKSRAKAVIASVAEPEMLPEIKKALGASLFPTEPIINPLEFERDSIMLTKVHEQQINRVILALRRNPDYQLSVTANYPKKEGRKVAKARIRQIQNRWKKYGFDQERIEVSYQKFKEKGKLASIEMQVLTPSAKALEKTYNENSPLSLQITDGWFEKGESELLNKVDWKEGAYTTEANGRKVYIRIEETEKPRIKKFEECRGPLISDYQNHLEESWLSELREKYEVKVHEDVLNSLMESKRE